MIRSTNKVNKDSQQWRKTKETVHPQNSGPRDTCSRCGKLDSSSVSIRSDPQQCSKHYTKVCRSHKAPTNAKVRELDRRIDALFFGTENIEPLYKQQGWISVWTQEHKANVLPLKIFMSIISHQNCVGRLRLKPEGQASSAAPQPNPKQVLQRVHKGHI